MHSLEAVIAIMILLSYSSNIISVISENDGWRVARLSQESRDIAGVMNYLGYTELISGNSFDTFSEVASYLAGKEKMGVAITLKHLIKPLIRVGVLTSDEETYLRYGTNISQNIFGEDKQVIINGKKTLLEIRNTTFDANWKTFDVLVIPIEGTDIEMVSHVSLMNDTYNIKLLNFLRQGKGVIQISNLSNESFVDFDVQKNIFGLLWNDTSLPSLDFNSTFSDLNPFEAGYVLHKYFYVSPVVLNIEGVSNLNVSEEGWWDMTTGIVVVYIGDTNHTIGSANCTVNDGGVCIGDSRSTLNFSSTINSTNGIYKFKLMSLKHEDYGVLLINSTGLGYDKLYIDENQDLNFTNDGYFSGLFQGDIIELDGNNYTISLIDVRGNSIEFYIEESHVFFDMNKDNKVYSSHGFGDEGVNRSQYVLVESDFETNYGGQMPVSIANYGRFTGRTAWITDNIVSLDEWHLLRNLILWVSPKTIVLSTIQDNARDVVSSDFVLLANKDMSQPYVMTWKSWYYD
ncbi:MAG: hypothetical protein GQ477_01980 [Nanohaloarchaea archaeon]|nr:hypothetical protein [Candidatus Nanohaloarchaea archaeon]